MLYRVGVLVVALCVAVGCSNVEKGTGQALGNIGSAINHESKKVWIDPKQPAQSPEEERREDEVDSRRY